MTSSTHEIRVFVSNLIRGAGLTALLALSACSSSEKSKGGVEAPVELLPGFQPLSAPAGGFAAYTPIIKDIPPGADVTYCTYTDHITDEELFVHTIGGVQSQYGHHEIAFYTINPETPRTEQCGGQDMTKFRQLLGGTGGEGAFVYKPPANVGTIVPKGAQFVIQTHWINTGTEPTDGQAMIITVPGTNGPDRIPVGSVAVVNLGFNIPASTPSYVSASQCTFDKTRRLIMSIGHEHEWGTHVKAEVTRAAGATEVLFDHPFQPSYTFNPPLEDYGVAQPLVFSPGDTLKMTCEWNNDTTAAIQFPREMCVFFGYALENEDAVCLGTGGADGGAASGMWQQSATDAATPTL